MELYLAGEYIFTTPQKTDVGIFGNRLLSYDYQRKFTDVLIDWRENLDLFLAGMDNMGEGDIKKYMRIYMAGVSEKDMPPKDSNALFSFEGQGKQTFDRLKDSMKSAKLFIDSGAYTAWTKGVEINVDEYISWLNERSEDIYLCGQVDSIPPVGATLEQIRECAQITWENYLYMKERLKNPDALLYTFHIGEPIEFLKQALSYKDKNGKPIPYIALGGLVGKTRAARDRFLELCFKTIKNSDNPDVKVHTFGMTDFNLLEKYPITSADSTSWIMVGAMGNIMTDDGNVGVSIEQKNNPCHFSHLNKEHLKGFIKNVEEYGFTLEGLAQNRDDRILYNAIYMQKKIAEIGKKSRKFSYKKSLF